MTTLTLKSGKEVSILGQGTWRMGEKPSQKKAEINALKLGIDLGMGTPENKISKPTRN